MAAEGGGESSTSTVLVLNILFVNQRLYWARFSNLMNNRQSVPELTPTGLNIFDVLSCVEMRR